MTPLAIAGGLSLGIVIGIISGMIGIEGGAFLIPDLIFFYGMSQKTAQGTSVATLLLPIGHLCVLDLLQGGARRSECAVLIAVGFAIGGLWAQHLSDAVLRKGLAVLLVALASNSSSGVKENCRRKPRSGFASHKHV